jgi:hypothetical protein
LFWLRQSINFLFWICEFFFYGQFAQSGDEIRISQYWKIHPLIITSSTAFIGITVLLFITFKIIPTFLRLTFLLSGIVGGILGFLLWFVFLGKLILPN